MVEKFPCRAGFLACVGRSMGWENTAEEKGDKKYIATFDMPCSQCFFSPAQGLATEADLPGTMSNISTLCAGRLKEERPDPISVETASGQNQRLSVHRCD